MTSIIVDGKQYYNRQVISVACKVILLSSETSIDLFHSQKFLLKILLTTLLSPCHDPASRSRISRQNWKPPTHFEAGKFFILTVENNPKTPFSSMLTSQA